MSENQNHKTDERRGTGCYVTVADSIRLKRIKYDGRKGMCKCGGLQPHKLIYCHNCGTKFEAFTPLSILDLIEKRTTYFGRERSIKWFEAIYRRKLVSECGDYSMNDFIKATGT